ncbi:MAG: hypothetical protein WC306_00950 [Candidatus Paceibacterota bacterium]|jgi:hypothetical protein
MTKVSKIVSVLFILIFLGVVGFIGIKVYQKRIETFGTLKVTFSPKNTTAVINGKLYKNSDGVLALKLLPNQYKINFSYPGYSSIIDKQIEVKARETLDLGKIYLFPVSWPKEELIANDSIDQFYVDKNMVHLISFKKVAKNYEWNIYNRSTKENQKFYQTSSLPQEIIFSPDSKKIITMIKDNDWKVVFLPKSLIDKDINLNNEFSAGLKQANLQTKQLPKIKQIVFVPKNVNDEILVRTDQGLYHFNYLERAMTRIIDSPISPFLLNENYLYFIKNNGLFSSLNLDSLEEQQLSLSSFKDSDESLDSIIIKKAPQKNIFLVIKDSGKTYLLNEKTKNPPILEDKIANGNFSLTGNYLLLYTKEKKIIVYDLNQEIKTEKNLYSDSFPQWFLDDNCLLFSNDNQLKIYNLETQETWSVINDLKNSNFIYDSSLNYIFYLSATGIIKTSL